MSATATIDDVLSGAARWAVVEGDSGVVARGIPDCSIDAIVSDPPAGIAFMGKEWDHDRGGKEHWIEWLAGILKEAFRVLKPGGHMFLWALPRTSHWTAEAGERAGFELRECHYHLFGSGFPKSLNVSKAIDDAGGTAEEVERWRGWGTATKPAAETWLLFRKPLEGTVAANVLRHGTGGLNIDAARVGTGDDTSRPNNGTALGLMNDDGWQPKAMTTAGNPAGRWPANLILSHTAWEETHCPCGAVLSFIARFCPECGSGDVEHRRDGCREVGERRVKREIRESDGAVRGDGWGTKGSGLSVGAVDETVAAYHCLASCPCGLSTLAPSGGAAPRCRCGRAMAWACPVARLDEQSGECPGFQGFAAGAERKATIGGGGYSGGFPTPLTSTGHGDTGGASRFFHCLQPPDNTEPFFYVAKPSASETEAGCEALPLRSAAENVDREEGSAGMQSPRAGAGRLSGRRNNHPTKKPIELMRLLCKLITPPGGIVLDLFGGSCTTVCAGALEGFRAIAIELDSGHVAIGRARATFWARLAGTRAAAVAKPRPVRAATNTGQGSLW